MSAGYAGPSARDLAYWDAIWPGERPRRVIAPVRVGVDRRTGKMIIGNEHVDQSMTVIFATRFHERVLRRWVGSFVPHMLGELAVPSTVLRFWWAIMTAIDLWEPCYDIQQIRLRKESERAAADPLPTAATTPDRLRLGEITMRHDGVDIPRGHLGDKTPATRRAIGLVKSDALWEISPA